MQQWDFLIPVTERGDPKGPTGAQSPGSAPWGLTKPSQL